MPAISLITVATTTKVFVAQLVGLPVFGPDGESIGKIRDLVVALRTDTTAPRVLGLVVELATRRRIFVPMLRVTSIEPNAVTLSTGSVNLRRFTSRPNEVLVIGQLIDARVTVRSSGAVATVLDAAVEPTRTRDWVLCRVAVRERTGRIGRRGPVNVLSWEEINAPGTIELTHAPQDAVHLLALFDRMRATDVAAALHDLPAKRRYEVADALDDERLADVIQELPDDDQKDVLSHLDDERAADVLEAMDPDDAADLLAELSEMDKDRLLALMEPEESAPVRRLLEYPTHSAGGLMTPEPVVLTPDAPVAEALARVRNPDLTPALASMVFVCRPPSDTPTGKYLGCVHTQRLLREPPSSLVAAAVDAELASLRPDDSLVRVTRYFAAYNLVCAPVLDEQNHLLGAVTVDDILDHLLPGGWRESEAVDGQDAGHEPGHETGQEPADA